MRALVLTFALSACATAAPTPINIAANAPAAPTEIATNGQRDALMLALSGGGARAAAFSLGALQQLRDTSAADGAPLTQHLALITSVSGGSITAAYYGLHGDAGLDSFRAAYLDKDWGADLHMNPLSPFNWPRAIGGGMNGPDRLADWLDAQVFAGARMASLNPRPQIWLNATDLYNGAGFAFTPLYFNAICADLGQLRIADAVAASMAFPVVFSPVLIEPHPQSCAPQPAWVTRALSDRAYSERARVTARAFAAYRDTNQMRYLHLSDGGVLDNLGLGALTLLRDVAETPNTPLTPRDAARLRRLTVLVVNAEGVLEADWQNEARGPSGADTAEALLDIYIADGNRAAYDGFRAALAAWRDDLVAWRCALPAAEAQALTEGIADWVCDDLSFNADMLSFRSFDAPRRDQLGAVPTRVTLPPETLDALIAAGRDGVAMNEAVRAFAK